jgi:parallel beta-helix repeat protein
MDINKLISDLWKKVCYLLDKVKNNVWLTTGNSNIEEDNFLGTINDADLIFKTHDEERVRITSDGLVGVGTDAPTTDLDINGQIRLRGGSPGVNKVLTSDVNGVGSWQNISVIVNDEWVSVTDYGAIGNGITDDTISIQNALNSGAKLILFPQGVYLITAQLKIKSNTTLFGYGATIFRGAAIDNLMINDSDGITGLYGANTNISVYGLAFNGNRVTFPSNSTLLTFGHVSHVIVKDCEFYNVPGVWHGLEFNAAENSQVEGCYFHEGQGNRNTSELFQIDLAASLAVFPWFGPYDNTPCKNLIITGNLFQGLATGQGVGIGSHTSAGAFPHTDILISNNTFRNINTCIALTNYKNLVIDGNIADGYVNGANWIISNNHFNTAVNIVELGTPIYISFVKGVVICGNIMDNSFFSGIFITGCDNFNIVGNTIKNAGQNPVTDVATIDVLNSTNGNITNNIVLKDPTVGLITSTNSIRVGTGSPANITIENNTCTTRAATTTFSLTGTNIIVGNNTINGSVVPLIKTTTINYTYTSSDLVLNVDTTAGNVAITINPTIFNKTGVRIVKTTADANTVTITPSSGTINGLASIVLTVQNHMADIKSDWSNLNAIVLFNM